MKKIKAVTAEPLELTRMIILTGRDALTTMEKYKVRIMNFSPDQTVEAVDIIEYGGFKWGILPLKAPQKGYDYFAVRVK